MHQCVIGFSLISRDGTQTADRSQKTSTGLSVYVYGGLHIKHKVLALPANVLFSKTNSVMFF